MNMLTQFVVVLCVVSVSANLLRDTKYVDRLRLDSRLGKSNPHRIAIIGGGIGGTSTAYFTRTLFGSDVTIDLYEPEVLCGRVATITVGGREYESGGSVIHGKNMYAKEIASTFGLKHANDVDQTLAFFDGKKYILQTSTWWIVSIFKMLWSFGLDLIRLGWIENAFMKEFESVYSKQQSGHSFTSVGELMNALGHKQFIHATEKTSCDLFSKIGLSDFTISTLVSGGLRANYGQNCGVNGFVGMVSMAGIQSDLWSIKNGNKMLCSKLVDNSDVTIIKERVASLSRDGDTFSVAQQSGTSRQYDVVVVATPINRDKSHINVTGVCSDAAVCPDAATDPRHYRKTVATFIKGKLRPSLFDCNSIEECPGVIFTTVNNLFYRSIGFHVPVDFDPNKDSVDSGVYKIFSNESLSEEQLQTVFESYTEVREKVWFAYPFYSPPDKLSSFILNHGGVFYTSPIEWAASAMEMSIISGKNAALMAFNNWFGISENIDPRLNSTDSKPEL